MTRLVAECLKSKP